MSATAEGPPSLDKPRSGGRTVEELFARYGDSYRIYVTIGGMIASFTMVFTGTIVNVAVPSVMGAFGVGQDKAQLLTTAFIATMTASQLLNTWFVSVFGPRNAFVIILLVFLTGGLICWFSNSLDLIILGRVMQGFSAGVIQPLVMVTMFQVFPPERRGSAMGIYATSLVLALGMGPLVGGITIDATHWRMVFLVSLPLVMMALLIGGIFMPHDRPKGPRRPFDWLGYALLCVALFLLLSAMASGQRLGWTSDTILLEFLGAFLAAAGFVLSQFRRNASLLDFSVMRNGGFLSAVAVAFVFGIGNFATTYGIPVFSQLVQYYSPTKAGMVLLPASLLVVAMLPITGRAADRAGPLMPLMGGFLLFVIAALLISDADIDTVFWVLAGFAMLGRLGMAFITPNLMTNALRFVSPDKLSAASGTINFFRQLGGGIGTSLFVVLVEIRTEVHSEALTATQTTDNAATREFLARTQDILRESGVPEAQHNAYALEFLGQTLEAQATTLAFQDGFLGIALVFLVAMIPAYFLGRGAAKSSAAKSLAANPLQPNPLQPSPLQLSPLGPNLNADDRRWPGPVRL